MSGKSVTSKLVYSYVMDEDEDFIIDEEAPPGGTADLPALPCDLSFNDEMITGARGTV